MKRKPRRADLESKAFILFFSLFSFYHHPDTVSDESLVCLCSPHNPLCHLNMRRGVPFKQDDIPHSLFCRSDKKAAADRPDEKELKKKEKQRLEKEKRELKEKQEREKKEQKEREKKENEMKKKFKVSGVVLTEEGAMEVERAAKEGGVMSWHTNLSGFIPPRARVELSNMCRLKRNLCQHPFHCW